MMLNQKQFALMFGDSTVPMMLACAKTDDVLYGNGSLVAVLGEERQFLGEKYYNVIKHEECLDGENLVQVNPSFCWERAEGESLMYQKKVYDGTLERGFDCSYSLFSLEQESVILIRCEPLSDGIATELDFDRALSQSFHILKSERAEKVESLLEILSGYYKADCAYLYQIHQEEQSITLEKQWLSPQGQKLYHKGAMAVQLESLIDFSKAMEWVETRNTLGILDCVKARLDTSLPTLDLEMLEAFDMENIVVRAIEDDQGQLVALIGLGDCGNLTRDYRLLWTVSEFLRHSILKSGDDLRYDILSRKDVLTGCFSRKAYSDVVAQLVEACPPCLGVVLANVNGLKTVNAEFGYAKGDSYIKRSSEMLEKHFFTKFYRISGDEFVAFWMEEGRDFLEERVRSFREKMLAESNHCLAVGHAWGQGFVDVLELVKEAETLMYINKQEYYHGNFEFADISFDILSELLEGLKNQEFMIYLQPQVRLADSSLYGAEALIRRFDKKNQKMIYPDQFVPLYEKKSVIRHVDLFVVEEVCKLLSRWQKAGQDLLQISVNLSRVTLMEYGIVDTVSKICDKYEIAHDALMLEVTERVGLIENNVASSLVQEFQAAGFRISLDDFGCAYSNIVTLSQIDVDEVKLDKSLVDDITTNRKNTVLVQSVLHMCQELENISTLAEGIEDKAQADLLYSLQCHLGQGYYYSRPVPVDEFCLKYLK